MQQFSVIYSLKLYVAFVPLVIAIIVDSRVFAIGSDFTDIYSLVFCLIFSSGNIQFTIMCLYAVRLWQQMKSLLYIRMSEAVDIKIGVYSC